MPRKPTVQKFGATRTIALRRDLYERIETLAIQLHSKPGKVTNFLIADAFNKSNGQPIPPGTVIP